MNGRRRIFFEEGLVAALLFSAIGGIAAGAVFGLPTPAEWSAFWNFRQFDAGFAVQAFALLVGFAFGFFAGGYLIGYQLESWHHAGLEFIDEPLAFRSRFAAAERKLFSDAQKNKAVAGLTLGGVELSRTREVGHFVVAGLPGSGKTTLIVGIIGQALRRGDRLIIHDPKGDYLDALAAARIPLVVMGPWDSRARPWDIARDIAGPAAAEEFARACFPSENAGANQFFVNAARALLAGVIKDLQQNRPGWGWGDLEAVLSAGPDAILAAAWRGDAVTRTTVSDTTSNGARAVFGELAAGVAWIATYARAFDDAEPFSVAEWLVTPGKEKVIVLNSDARFAGAAEKVFGALLGIAADTVASPAMREVSADAPGVWVLLDEFPQLGATGQAAALKIEEMGRSRGIRVVKAMQDQSQLFAKEGRDRGMSQKSMQQTRIFLAQSIEAAAEACRALGDREIRRVETPQISGAGSKKIVQEKSPVLRVEALTGLAVVKEGLSPGIEAVAQVGDLLGLIKIPFIKVPRGGGALIGNPLWDRPPPAPVAAGGGDGPEGGPTADLDIPTFEDRPAPTAAADPGETDTDSPEGWGDEPPEQHPLDRL